MKTIKDLLNHLNKITKEDPSLLELPLVYSRDDEGNGFNHVYYDPSLGYFDEERDGDFICEDVFDEHGLNKSEINSICIN